MSYRLKEWENATANIIVEEKSDLQQVKKWKKSSAVNDEYCVHWSNEKY